MALDENRTLLRSSLFLERRWSFVERQERYDFHFWCFTGQARIPGLSWLRAFRIPSPSQEIGVCILFAPSGCWLAHRWARFSP